MSDCFPKRSVAKYCDSITDFQMFFFLDFLLLDNDECQLMTHDCSVHAACANTEGSFTCTCKTGYLGSGKICTGKMQSMQFISQGNTDSDVLLFWSFISLYIYIYIYIYIYSKKILKSEKGKHSM